MVELVEQELCIVFLNQSHIRQLLKLEAQCFTLPWDETQFSRLMTGEHFKVLGMMECGELRGYLSFLHVRDQAEIMNLAVHPGKRQKGLGKKLMKALLGYCRIHGVQWISLEVRMSNVPAISLYQGFGFKEVGRREKYYTDTGEDALVLQLELADALKLPFSQKI
ncbi:ribosomal-protein-alanine acetyltransferase [Desulfonatronospira thiodismutans ASO3-1]|uniref:Ribosomal-protein-alanine acetyltransferase n=1 Tax=Desulfonatronospira thiodismutans ASO3-1 TaxID=555779 RepID=D6SLF5_9BACT|nr:ribosomal protein S18-alanine N-acetyltransferase [Desulfonatronospira thiodismutans]EFI35516.1 ribosomal-protein-alanine acetyltransferase [Desulfonatronospira thiodismutans ASO3-1]